jgi:hypothetical protein
MFRALLLPLLSFLTFLGSVFSLLEYIGKTAWGRELLARFEQELVSFAQMLTSLRVNQAVSELSNTLWKWARILLALIITAVLLRLSVVLLALIPSFVLFCLAALSLDVLTNARSLAKIQAAAVTIFAIGLASLLFWGVQHDAGFRAQLVASVEQFGLRPLTPTAAVVYATLATTLVIAGLSLFAGLFFSAVGLGLVIVLWCAVKTSAVVMRHVHRKALRYVTVTVCVAASVIGIVTYITE